MQAKARSLSALLAAILLAGTAGLAQAPQAPKVIQFPPDIGSERVQRRSAQQLATLDAFAVFYFFRFQDRRAESGIRFRHRIVDDAGRDYKMVHYDHGNGLAAADVDGDGLSDLYFTSQVGRNELWRNLGDGRFEDMTDDAGVAVSDRISVGATFADYDNDGDADLFVTTVKMGNLLFQNDGHGRFRDVSSEAGVDYTGHSSGALFFDYDGDGRLDLFVSNVGVYTTQRKGREGYWIGVEQAFSGHLYPERTETSLLYRNLGNGKFADVTSEAGLADGSWSGDATALDLTGDGRLDLYLLNMQGDDHFYVNVDGRRFEDRTAEYFPKTPWGAMGIEALDYDNNGFLDLALVDMHSDMSELIELDREKLKARMQWTDDHLQGGANNVFGNAFFRNLGPDADGKIRFEEASDELGTENYWPWGLSAGDLNADGWEDLFITASMNYPFIYAVNSLLLNNAGTRFLDSEYVVGVEPRRGEAMVTDWFDIDCGGADEDHEDCRGATGPVTVRGALGSRSSVIFDLDRDGDLDIVTNDFNSPPMVLVSDLSEQTEVKWVEIELEGSRSNRDGLGSIVRVVVGDRTLTQSHDGKSGYLSHSSLPLYFGLGTAESLDRIEVDWLSGARQVVTEDLMINSRIRIVEPDA